jgi:hypothetical protein
MMLVQKNPMIPTRSGNKALAQDTKIMQAYVISGTIADTMLRQMDNVLKVRLGIKKRCGEELVISIL